VVERAIRATDASLAISPLVEMECLVGPLRASNHLLEAEYRRMFATIRRLEFVGSCFEDAARIRASSRLKSLDALHLACARHHGCTELWTNDQRFGAVGEGIVRVLTP
jgi:predicted nucleic acid-binding protein